MLRLFQKKSLTRTRIREKTFKPLLFCFCISHMDLGSGFYCVWRIFSSSKFVFSFCEIVSKDEWFLQRFTVKVIIWVYFCYCSVYSHFPTELRVFCVSVLKIICTCNLPKILLLSKSLSIYHILPWLMYDTKHSTEKCLNTKLKEHSGCICCLRLMVLDNG